MENTLSEKERIRNWKRKNEARILYQWDSKNCRIFLIITFILWAFALFYLILSGFDSVFSIFFLFVYPLLMFYTNRKKRQDILQKRKEAKDENL